MLGPALKRVIAYVLLIEVANQILFGRIDIPNIHSSMFEIGRYDVSIPRGTLLGGAVIGALYGLIATGIILVYRANRIINFAQAQLGAVPAVVCLLLIARRGWPYLVALPLMLIGAVILGGFTEVALIRRFRKAPRLILTVVTIGVGFLLLIFEFYAKQWVGGELKDVLSLRFPTPFQRFTFHLGPSTLSGDHFFAIAVGLPVVLALAAFFRYTDIGIAVRASAENSERAALLGIPVARVSTIVWMIAAVLSAIGIFLRTPLIGLPFDGFVGPAILLLGLAAAVIARMESMPIAFMAGCSSA